MVNFDLLFLTSKKEKSTKGMILRCLAAYTTLSIVHVRSVLKKEFSRDVTYQAIRQALHELMDERIVEQEGKQYRISPAFILDLKDALDTLEKATKKRVRPIDNETSQVTLKNLYELGNFVLFALDHQYFSTKRDLSFRLRHLWIPFSDEERRNRLVRVFKENKTDVQVEKRSPADRMLARWYRQYGKVGLGSAITQECIIHGDCVVQIFMDRALTKKMDEVYSLKGLIRLDLFRQVAAMTYDPHRIDLVITRNAHVAEEFRKG